MPPADSCPTCLRPKFTDEDLERWNRDLLDGPRRAVPLQARPRARARAGADARERRLSG